MHYCALVNSETTNHGQVQRWCRDVGWSFVTAMIWLWKSLRITLNKVYSYMTVTSFTEATSLSKNNLGKLHFWQEWHSIVSVSVFSWLQTFSKPDVNGLFAYFILWMKSIMNEGAIWSHGKIVFWHFFFLQSNSYVWLGTDSFAYLLHFLLVGHHNLK